MQSTTRRHFLKQASLLSLSTFPAAFSSLRANTTETNGRILVVIQLSGGNDGLNTVVPYTDEGYARHRRELRLATDQLIQIDASVGLHPSLRGMADLLEDGQLTIVQGVGYPQPNRSHAVSMAIWQSASLDPLDHTGYGWLGQSMDEYQHELSGAPDMVLLGDDSPPLAIRGRRSTSVAMANLHDLHLLQPKSFNESERPTNDSLLNFIHSTSASAVRTASLLESVATSNQVSPDYPTTGLGGRLKSIANLIKAGVATPVYYTIQDGYDTHSAQLPTHSRLLSELSGALQAFQEDLTTAGLDDRIVTLCFSEFGRRVEENGSLGTDHGAAGPVFLAGKCVKSGLLGQPANCEQLIDGDLTMQFDFRSIYHALLSDWLHLPTPRTLKHFTSLPLLRQST